MRIAYLIRESKEEVVSSCYYELMEEIQRKGNEVIVLNEKGSFGDLECIKVDARRIIDYPGGAFNKLLYSRAVKKKLSKLEPDLVFGSMAESIYFLDDLKIPKAVVINDDLRQRLIFTPWFSEFKLKYGFFPTPQYTKLGVMIDYFFQLKSIKKADGVIFVNKESEMEYKKELNCLTKAVVNGVSFKNLVLDSRTKKEAKKIKELFPEPIFLFMARLDLQKNPLVFVRAAERVLKKNNAFFLIAGDGVMYNTVGREIRRLGLKNKVKLLGWKNGLEKKALLHSCYAYVLPSNFEPCCVSLLEAMACSKPSIVSNVGGLKEAIDRETGIRVNPNDVGQLSEAMNFILSHPKKASKMGRNARKKIQKFYEWKKIAASYIDFFDELIEWKRKK